MQFYVKITNINTDKFYITYLSNTPAEKNQMQEPSACRIFPFVYLDICADIESVNTYETALKTNKKSVD